MKTGKIIKHVGIISFATLGMILMSILVAFCCSESYCKRAAWHRGPAQQKGSCAPQSSRAERLGGYLWQFSSAGINPQPRFWASPAAISKVFQQTPLWAAPENMGMAKGKTSLREWKNPIACVFSKGVWRWESALSGICGGRQSHVIRVGSFSPLQSAGTLLSDLILVSEQPLGRTFLPDFPSGSGSQQEPQPMSSTSRARWLLGARLVALCLLPGALLVYTKVTLNGQNMTALLEEIGP